MSLNCVSVLRCTTGGERWAPEEYLTRQERRMKVGAAAFSLPLPTMAGDSDVSVDAHLVASAAFGLLLSVVKKGNFALRER